MHAALHLAAMARDAGSHAELGPFPLVRSTLVGIGVEPGRRRIGDLEHQRERDDAEQHGCEPPCDQSCAPARRGRRYPATSPFIASTCAYLLAQIWQNEEMSVPEISLRPVTYTAFIIANGANFTSESWNPSARE